MPLPFSFTGTLTVSAGGSNVEEFAKRLEAALSSEGGSNIRSSEHGITFRGLTDYRSLSPLANVANGVIELNNRSSALDLTYTIKIDRTPFVMSVVVALVGLALVAAGITQFGFFAIFGLGVLVLSTAYSFIIRFRLLRWLRRVSEQIPSASQ